MFDVQLQQLVSHHNLVSNVDAWMERYHLRKKCCTAHPSELIVEPVQHEKFTFWERYLWKRASRSAWLKDNKDKGDISFKRSFDIICLVYHDCKRLFSLQIGLNLWENEMGWWTANFLCRFWVSGVCVGEWIFSLFLVGLNFKAIKASVHRPFTRDTIVWWLAFIAVYSPLFCWINYNEIQGRIWEVVSALKVRGETTLGRDQWNSCSALFHQLWACYMIQGMP
jgi:hypothetical protein